MATMGVSQPDRKVLHECRAHVKTVRGVYALWDNRRPKVCKRKPGEGSVNVAMGLRCVNLEGPQLLKPRQFVDDLQKWHMGRGRRVHVGFHQQRGVANAEEDAFEPYGVKVTSRTSCA